MAEGRERDAPPPEVMPAADPARTWKAWAGALGLLGAAAAVAWAWAVFLWPPAAPPSPAAARAPDPRLDYAGPFRNLHPDVAYVGDGKCAGCHFEINESFARHPMGRSLAPISAVNDVLFDSTHNNPFTALGAEFLVERQGGRVFHRQTGNGPDGQVLYRVEQEVHFAIGSGEHGRSFLTNRDGFLFQTPISWYVKKEGSTWDRSPGGFEGADQVRRPVTGECLFCHANRAHFRENSINHFDPPIFTGHAIGCERCHGPGGRHIDSQHANDIVDPGRLDPVLRDAVCEQCHLEGHGRVLRRGRGLYDFRPGLPLEPFWAVFVWDRETGEGLKAVTHVEQMHQSRCWKVSKEPEKLGCVSCHDPHAPVGPGARVAFYRQRCLTCHKGSGRSLPSAGRPAGWSPTAPGCSLPADVRLGRNPADSCIDCHMPRLRLENVAHAAGTDHTVPRVPGPAADGAASPPSRLVSFHPRPATDKDLGRDQAIAMVQLARNAGLAPGQGLPGVLPLLEKAVWNDPADTTAWIAKGEALLLLKRPAEALAAFRTALHHDPEREEALVGAARATRETDRAPETLDCWRKAIALNPHLASYRQNLAEVLLHLRAWEEAGKECRAWLDLDPASVPARKAWITVLLHEGKQEEVAREFARLEALAPQQRGELRAWLQARQRGE